MAQRDPHSYTDDTQPITEHLDWRARVDFATRTLSGVATLTFREPATSSGPLDLDTRDLAIEAVLGEDRAPLAFALSSPEAILGARLRVELPAGARRVTLRYRTSPGASALQWLDPAQTAGGQEPFLFSQCQAIHARSVVPLQDTPRLRIRYRAELTVPAWLRGLMAAAHVGRVERGDEAIETWEMPQPISPYLLAFAVGDLASRDVGPRTRVWAEPKVVEQAAQEFGGVEAMITTAESLFGRYDWDRFDILTMPPSFPYGGMENPRLTFLTPTLLAGDRSLVNVVAHELAHSWTGNLVGSDSAEHFWLNEGFTVFAERRIIEALSGAAVAALHAAIGRRELERDMAQFADRPELTRLRTHLSGIDPDEAFSRVPYEKGYLFLRTLEEAVGRDAFSGFLKKYINAFRWQTLTSEAFADFVRRELPQAAERVSLSTWLDGAGIPGDAPAPSSARLDAITALANKKVPPDRSDTSAWTPTEWQLYLDLLERPVTLAFCEALEERFHLTASRNCEVLVAWLVVANHAGFQPALPRTEEVLSRVGRMKYLKPLYQALAGRPETRALARRCFDANSAGYHPIARQVIESLLRRGTESSH
jgi:aminopeptidase N